LPVLLAGRGWRRLAVTALAATLAATLVQPALPGVPAARVRAADPPPFLAEDGGAVVVPRGPAAASIVPAGFTEDTVFSGLDHPTVVRFAPDGRVFVAEKRGVIKIFDSLTDTTPTTFVDFSSEVMDFWDRGFLGMALDPNFPTTPDVYVLYARDGLVDGPTSLWNDSCPNPPGATTDGCVISGQLSRFTASGDTAGPEQPLITDWCQQYPSHGVGTLQFGPDGMLYAGAGDGASFTFADYGQRGDPLNPCGDPPAGSGGTQTAPTAEGGALRSQDLHSGVDPVTLDGSIVRVDPATGAAAAGNPASGHPDANAARIIAYGMRNPFRFTFRPGTTELWLGDVGFSTWEEIDRITDPTASVRNLGWPCYEGTQQKTYYGASSMNVCESLYAAGSGAVLAPYFAYSHADQVVNGESCPSGSSAIAGLAFYQGTGSYPSGYDGALFFADNSRNCIWVAPAGANGRPDMAQRSTFVAGASSPVDLEIGPDGNLYYVDFDGGTIRRIRYAGIHAPTALAAADPTSGPVPLAVSFSGIGSSDPDADPLSYAWDLDGDGQYDDATGVSAAWTYSNPGTYHPALEVTDGHGGSDTDTLTITAGNSAPAPAIVQPQAGSGSTWWVGKTVSFSGTASDAEDGASLPAADLAWELILHHCPSNCHTHTLATWNGMASGSFSAPDHEYPSYLELKLTATDSGGLSTSTSVDLYPRTADISVTTSPGGLDLTVFNVTEPAPFSVTTVEGGTTTVAAPLTQSLGGTKYHFVHWSDGGAATHTVVAASGGISLRASYSATVAVRRVRGSDAIPIAIALAQREFPSGAATVYLVSPTSPGKSSAAAAAAAAGAPLLVTRSGSLPSSLADELVRLDPGRVVLVGNGQAIRKKVNTAISDLLNP
jgi:glucose/arabinose dehydrogenase